jgi:hypothetical protein
MPVSPTALLSFEIEADAVLDLRDGAVLHSLSLDAKRLTSLDKRFEMNESGNLTPLQMLGVAVYRTGRFAGILTPSRYSDVAAGYCFDLIPDEVKLSVWDSAKTLDRITVR